MKKLINLLFGYLEVLVSGAFPERLLNLCAQHRVRFWHLTWLDETTFTFRIALKVRGRIEELAQRAMCETSVRARRGAAHGHFWGAVEHVGAGPAFSGICRNVRRGAPMCAPR